jgi:hypothetical protein
MSLQGGVIDWVADHRKHHTFTHAGHGVGLRGMVTGLWHAHVGWLFETHGQASSKRFAADLVEDPTMRRINRSFPLIALGSLVLPFVLGLALSGDSLVDGGLSALLWAGLVRIFLVHHITWSINSICHFFGSRRFDTDDESTNVFWLALPSLGEAWHHTPDVYGRHVRVMLRTALRAPVTTACVAGSCFFLSSRAGTQWVFVRTRPHGAKEMRVKLPLQCWPRPPRLTLTAARSSRASSASVASLLGLVGKTLSLAYNPLEWAIRMLVLMRRTATFLALGVLAGLVVGGSPGRADALVTPTLDVQFQPEPSAVGRPASIDAELEGGQDPEGTITFEVFATSDSECHGSPVRTAIVPVHGDDDYSTGAGGEGETIVITALGLYPVRVSYSGDASNGPVSTACGEPTLKINAAPKIVLATQEPPVVGEPVQLIANLIGGFEPTGTVRFFIFSATDQGCEEEPLLDTVGEVVGGRVLVPQTILPSRVGDYPIDLVYSGDQMNVPAFIECGEPGAVLHVARAQPALTLMPSPSTVVGEPVDATATLAGGYRPTGSITFNLYPPLDATCSGLPALTVSEALVGALAGSGALATNAVGEYRFTALYSGDANNLPAESQCGTGSVTTGKARPTLTATSHAEGEGGLIGATAALAGGFEPSGTVTFTLFGPDATSCSGPKVFRVIAPVIEDAARSGTFSTGGSGRFALLTTYSGDARNEAAATATCQRLGVSASTAARDVSNLRLGARASRVRLDVVCPPQAGGQCHGVIRLIAVEHLRGGHVVGLAARSPRLRQVEVGHATYEVPTGQTQSLSIAISPGGRALARRFAGLLLRAVLQQGSPSGTGARIGR